ncbi:DUF1842 domain-containing protein [Trinickia terrae]|uniref:DUF1842 domain-containing protein n=1 Tax=Trinickia terrae TaxID=2571161 RepID=A0A4U1ID97_9BURK|nr:DUF1842 domain-containing protein [Trinickia terrae]TKC91598.1 DUF1842 domain-containing protein [Trinickia terrae]
MSQPSLFHVTYSVATPVIGGPLLTLSLVVDTPNKKVNGIARITQTTNPPLEFRADVWGTFNTVQPVPAQELNILTLDGNPSGQYSQIAETFHFHGALHQWQSGQASYRYFDGHRWHAVENATVTLEKETLPTPPNHVVPMYAVSLQQSKATGNLSQMKQLAALAEQQLADTETIKAELDKLNAEIARLEGHA